MITDEQVEAAVDYLRDNAVKLAKAKAASIYLDDYSKVVKSQIMRENDNKSLGAQEAIAYSDPRYDQHLKAKRIADEEFEYLRWMMEAAQAKIDVWRTQSSNNRKGI
jgi:hypothetical protein